MDKRELNNKIKNLFSSIHASSENSLNEEILQEITEICTIIQKHLSDTCGLFKTLKQSDFTGETNKIKEMIEISNYAGKTDDFYFFRVHSWTLFLLTFGVREVMNLVEKETGEIISIRHRKNSKALHLIQNGQATQKRNQ